MRSRVLLVLYIQLRRLAAGRLYRLVLVLCGHVAVHVGVCATVEGVYVLCGRARLFEHQSLRSLQLHRVHHIHRDINLGHSAHVGSRVRALAQTPPKAVHHSQVLLAGRDPGRERAGHLQLPADQEQLLGAA